MVEKLLTDLRHAVTRYDRSQVTKKSYNRYALGLYLDRVECVVISYNEGKSLQECIDAEFNDRLRDSVIKYMNTQGYSLQA